MAEHPTGSERSGEPGAPKIERDYGILFYNTENKDSFDSNHAVIYRERIQNLQALLLDIAEFYKAKGRRSIIYQSMLD